MPSPNFKQALPSLQRILHQFAPQIRQHRLLIGSSFVALLVETGLRLLEPWPLKLIFDKLILTQFDTDILDIGFLQGRSPMFVLSAFALAIVAIAALRALAAYLGTVGMALAATHIITEIRSNLYSHLQRLSLSFHSKTRTGDLITRVTQDTDRLRDAIVQAMLPLITNILTLVGMLTVMLWMHWQLGLIAATVLPVFLFVANRVSKKISHFSQQNRQREGEMAATTAEALGAIKVVQALSLQKMLEKTFAHYNQKSLQDSARTQVLSAELERTVEVLVAIATAIILWQGVQLTLRQAITPGDLLVFVSYLKVAFKPMRQLAKYTGQIAKAGASGDRILDLLETTPDIRDLRGAMDAPPFRGTVEARNVSFAYHPEKQILRGLSFQVKSGQQVALVGSSGGGKSSLVSLLLRLYDPLEGQILIDGHDLREYKLDSLRRQISIVLQESVLFAASVRENIAYGCLGATDADVEAAARLANAHDFILGLPQGYDTVLGERGATLSGGQRQRIAIARAAIRKAPIVILDEPTTGLDQENEHIVTEALDRLTQGCTTFWISHNLKAVEHADLIVYIESGKVLEQGTHSELRRLGGRYAAMYALQTSIGANRFRGEYAVAI
jgi:ATP-binding cassette, subfamily B, bacterial